MFDLTIDKTNETDGRVRYTLGQPNWADRRIPDIRHPPATVQLVESRLIDVILLGDGYDTAADFEAQLRGWLSDFSKLKVYTTFAGAFRIRALFEPSDEPASTTRDSYYRCRVEADGKGISFEDSWWTADDTDGLRFRERLYAAVGSFTDANLRRYPDDLDLGDGNTAIKNTTLRDVYRNLIVCMLVRSAVSSNVSGMTRAVPRPAPDASRQVRVAFGAGRLHEFSHAFGLLTDEYINGRDTPSTRVNHPTRSVFTLSNVTYSRTDGDVPWRHLGPWGRVPRQAAGTAPDPVVGWLWVGGSVHKNVWHAEYRCLMNGSHDNFQFTQVASDDPTANRDGSYTEENGANLRDQERFCLWCQELVTIRILEKTDQFLETGDPTNLSAAGLVWWTRWEDDLRERYWTLFDVSQQIMDAEAVYAGLRPGSAGESLWRSDLYVAFGAAAVARANPVPALGEDELAMVLDG